jgi:Ca2+-binding EF-hand superfamily protein
MKGGSSSNKKSEPEHIGVLRQIFNKFDANKSGHVNANELENILKSLNVNASREAYNQILREADADGSLNYLYLNNNL